MNHLSALDCVLAARRSELRDLRALEGMVGLVGLVTALVHELQGERGLSSLAVAGRAGYGAADDFTSQNAAQSNGEAAVIPGQPSGTALLRLRAQRGATDVAQGGLLKRLGAIDREALSSGGHGARLFSRLAVALQAQHALAALRRQIDEGYFTVEQLVMAYSRLVAAWLSVVFEVADVAGEAQVSRQLIALFNLSHTKELVGQERALGSALFASGRVDDEARQRAQDLVESQLRGLAAFRHFATDTQQMRMTELQRRGRADERARLRRLLLEPTEHGALNPALGSPWFDACTAHMEELKQLEQAVLQELGAMCELRAMALEDAVDDLHALRRDPESVSSEQALMNLAAAAAIKPNFTPNFTPDSAPAEPGPLVKEGSPNQLGPELARHVMDLVQQQAQRLQDVTAELEEARASLQERKVVERAKGLLMAQAGMSEDQAYQALRRRAMQSGQRLAEVAQALLQRTN